MDIEKTVEAAAFDLVGLWDQKLWVVPCTKGMIRIKGYVVKSLLELMSAFEAIHYQCILRYNETPTSFNIDHTDTLLQALQSPVTIPLCLVQKADDPEDDITPRPVQRRSWEEFKTMGYRRMQDIQQRVRLEYPDDADAIAEIYGILVELFPNMGNWRHKILCNSGTTVNMHFQPNEPIDCTVLAELSALATRARVARIDIHACTFEVVLYAFTLVKSMPYHMTPARHKRQSQLMKRTRPKRRLISIPYVPPYTK